MTDHAVTRPNLNHIALTVTDFERSVPFYEQAFSIPYRFDSPHDGGVGKVLTDDDWSLLIVLHEHDANDGRPFSERTTGLDHVGLGVSSRRELVAWADHLEALGVEKAAVADRPMTQSPVTDFEYGAVLVFRDPDNIQLELFAPPEG